MMKQRSFRALRSALLCAGIVVLAALGGCAAQGAFRDGQELAAQGRLTDAITKYEEASRLEPGNAQYRLAYVQSRDRLVQGELARADEARGAARLDEAEAAYRSILARHGAVDRAIAGLRLVEQQRRIDAALKEADAALARNDADTARAKVQAVLLEAPRNEVARQLLRRLDERPARVSADTSLAAAYRKPITIEFKDVALRSVFEVISRTSGLNFLFDKDVKTDQKTSIYLKNSTIEAAVNLTLLTNQLDQRVLDANTVLVYPNTQAKQREYQPLTVRSFYLANADAKSVAASLKSLLKSRDVVVDEKLNLLIVRDSLDAIRLAEKIVALHDVPEPEVMLEVEILEVKRTRLLDLGIRWPDQLSLTPLPGIAGGALTLTDLRNINSNAIGVAVSPVTVNARKSDTDANILANPRIRARNHEKAKILIGERVPNITTTSTSTGFVAESVNYVDVGLKLEVEPTVYLDGEVAIKIALEVSNIISQLQTKSGSVAYQIGTRTAQTVLRLRDGENQVLAGLINDEDRRTGNKVPALGDVPVVGRLFGSQLDDATKTEIVLSITPRIVRNVRRPDPASMEFESGTETSLGARAATGPVAATPTTTAPSPTAPAAPVTGSGANPAPNAAVPVAPAAAATPAAATVSGPEIVAPANPAASLLLQGPAEVKPGEVFAVQVVVQSEQPVASLPVALSFDPKVVQVVSMIEGDFLRQAGGQSTFASRTDASGQVLLSGTRTGEGGATAAGTFAIVNLRAAAATDVTRISVLSAAPIGVGGRSVPLGPVAPYLLKVAP